MGGRLSGSSRWPEGVFRTSLIVGFPGEGKKEFAGLKEFVREARFDHLGVFTYSPEEGTDSFGLGNPVPEEEKSVRRDEIMAIQSKIVASIQQKYLHRRLEVLIEFPASTAKEKTIGRTRFQAPEVDGVVLIEQTLSSRQTIRPIERVEISSAEGYDLRGQIVR
jgi:ribosomal protein S12 methylthiotransferase